ncbi:MAG: hypothetical protein HOL89_20435 [Alphaproteobacteria bacterium]|nr:hypothetical protein [Alphaproteobacteria bacterium]
MAFLVCLPVVGNAYILPDTATNRRNGVVGCDQTPSGKINCPKGRKSGPVINRVYIPSGPSHVLINMIRNYINNVLRAEPVDLFALPALESNPGFTGLASAADSTLRGALEKLGIQKARLLSAQENLQSSDFVRQSRVRYLSDLNNLQQRYVDVLDRGQGIIDNARQTLNVHKQVEAEAAAQLKAMEKIVAERRGQFYRIIAGFGTDVPPPSTFRRTPRPAPASYELASKSNDLAIPLDPGQALVAMPVMVIRRPEDVQALTPTAPSEAAIATTSERIRKTVDHIRSSQNNAIQTERNIENLVLQTRSLDQEIGATEYELKKLGGMIRNGNELTRRRGRLLAETRARIEILDRSLPVKVVEAAIWESFEKLALKLAEKRTSWFGSLSGLNDVRSVMQDAVDLTDAVLAVIRQMPAALVHDHGKIPEIQEQIEVITNKYGFKFYTSPLGLPAPLSAWFEARLERR